MLPTFNEKITIFNVLGAKDNPSREEITIRTVIEGCSWSSVINRAVNGTETFLGKSLICRIPRNPNYKPYEEWKFDTKGFTLSLGDYVCKGDVLDPLKFKGEKFVIKAIKINDKAPMAHYRIEGV